MEKIVEKAQTGTKKGAIEQEIINRGRGHRCIHENTDHSSKRLDSELCGRVYLRNRFAKIKFEKINRTLTQTSETPWTVQGFLRAGP